MPKDIQNTINFNILSYFRKTILGKTVNEGEKSFKMKNEGSTMVVKNDLSKICLKKAARAIHMFLAFSPDLVLYSSHPVFPVI